MYMKEYDYLVVGAGLFAAVFVRQAIDAGKRCLVIDKRSHIGGNIYCENVDGIHVHLYGAHIFHTDNKEVWDYVNRFVTFNRYTNSPLANYEGILYNLPFNMNTFNKLWGVNTPKEAKDKIEVSIPFSFRPSKVMPSSSCIFSCAPAVLTADTEVFTITSSPSSVAKERQAIRFFPQASFVLLKREVL